MRPARVRRHVAAELRLLGSAGIGRVVEPVLERELLHLACRDAALDLGAPLQRLDRTHRSEPRQRDDDAAVGDRTARRSRCRRRASSVERRARSTRRAHGRRRSPSCASTTASARPRRPRASVASSRYGATASPSSTGASTAAASSRVSTAGFMQPSPDGGRDQRRRAAGRMSTLGCRDRTTALGRRRGPQRCTSSIQRAATIARSCSTTGSAPPPRRATAASWSPSPAVWPWSIWTTNPCARWSRSRTVTGCG